MVEDVQGNATGAGHPSPCVAVKDVVRAAANACWNRDDMAKPGCRDVSAKQCAYPIGEGRVR